VEIFKDERFLYFGTYMCWSLMDVVINDPEITSIHASRSMMEDAGIRRVLKWRGTYFDLPDHAEVCVVDGHCGSFWKCNRVYYHEPRWKVKGE
jgi:hypothetical protein